MNEGSGQPQPRFPVALAGAGPGDPGLMTRRCLELIEEADLILYDRLIPPEALDGARDSAELVYVGKEPGRPGPGQDEINRRLIEGARAGRRVLRLKGGDPFVFGRGAEEAAALREAGFDFEIVPGVSAGVAAAAYAGIPVTARDVATAVTFVTGHERTGEASGEKLQRLAATPGTIVFYMGLGNLAAIAEDLIRGGRRPEQPVAVVASGTTPDQKVVSGTLATIAELVESASVGPPALVVVGDVAGMREQLAWFERRPLFGRSVVVTRARDRAPRLAAKLRRLGTTAVELPVSRTEPIDADEPVVAEPLERFEAGEFDLIAFTSPAGVEHFFRLTRTRGLDARSFAGAELAAIGPSTARSLAAHGLAADHLPERFVTEGMIKTLEKVPMEGRRVLIARAREGRDVLPGALRERGAEVVVMPVYRTVPVQPDQVDLDRALEADFITFTSASSVNNLVRTGAVDPARFPPRVVTIGPVTTDAARAAGFRVAIEAERHDLDGLVEAVRLAPSRASEERE